MISLRRYSRPFSVVLFFLILGLAAWYVYAQFRLWGRLQAVQIALDKEDARLAWDEIQPCLKAWPNSAEVLFLAARAARCNGDLSAASKYLDLAGEHGWVPEAIDLERALLRLQQGEFARSEAYLMRCLELEHPDSALIAQILAPAYLRNFQLAQAKYCLERWLTLRPESALAWYTKGVLAERRLAKDEAFEAYAKSVELDPRRPGVRLALVKAYLFANRPRDAQPHLEILLKSQPDDSETLIEAAKCQLGLGNQKESAHLLDQVLQNQPREPQALHLRGKIELARKQASQAAVYLKRGLAAAPTDRELLYTWVRCLQEIGTPEEVTAAEQRLKQVEADLERLKDVTGKIPLDPTNADLRYEAGQILLRNGQDEAALRWLGSALAVNADHRPTHRLLAEYHEQKGDHRRAARHREALRAKESHKNF